MREKYRGFLICEVNEPESWLAWFYASPIEDLEPVFKSPSWFSDDSVEKNVRNKEKCLEEIKKQIDSYLKEIDDLTLYKGFISSEIPYKEYATSEEEALSKAKKKICEKLGNDGIKFK